MPKIFINNNKISITPDQTGILVSDCPEDCIIPGCGGYDDPSLGACLRDSLSECYYYGAPCCINITHDPLVSPVSCECCDCESLLTDHILGYEDTASGFGLWTSGKSLKTDVATFCDQGHHISLTLDADTGIMQAVVHGNTYQFTFPSTPVLCSDVVGVFMLTLVSTPDPDYQCIPPAEIRVYFAISTRCPPTPRMSPEIVVTPLGFSDPPACVECDFNINYCIPDVLTVDPFENRFVAVNKVAAAQSGQAVISISGVDLLDSCCKACADLFDSLTPPKVRKLFFTKCFPMTYEEKIVHTYGEICCPCCEEGPLDITLWHDLTGPSHWNLSINGWVWQQVAFSTFNCCTFSVTFTPADLITTPVSSYCDFSGAHISVSSGSDILFPAISHSPAGVSCPTCRCPGQYEIELEIDYEIDCTDSAAGWPDTVSGTFTMVPIGGCAWEAILKTFVSPSGCTVEVVARMSLNAPSNVVFGILYRPLGGPSPPCGDLSPGELSTPNKIPFSEILGVYDFCDNMICDILPIVGAPLVNNPNPAHSCATSTGTYSLTMNYIDVCSP